MNGEKGEKQELEDLRMTRIVELSDQCEQGSTHSKITSPIQYYSFHLNLTFMPIDNLSADPSFIFL